MKPSGIHGNHKNHVCLQWQQNTPPFV